MEVRASQYCEGTIVGLLRFYNIMFHIPRLIVRILQSVLLGVALLVSTPILSLVDNISQSLVALPAAPKTLVLEHLNISVIYKNDSPNVGS